MDSGLVAWEATIAIPKGRTELERVVDIDAELKLVEGTIYAAAFHGEVAAVSDVITSYSIHYTKLYDRYLRPAHRCWDRYGGTART